MNYVPIVCPFCSKRLKDNRFGLKRWSKEFHRFSCETCPKTESFPTFYRFGVWYSDITWQLFKVHIVIDNYHLATTYPDCPFDYPHTDLFVNNEDNRITVDPIDIPIEDISKVRALIHNILVFA